MGILTGPEILKQWEYGRIHIDPFDPSRLNPNSYNLRLSEKLLVYCDAELDMAKDNPTDVITIPPEGLVLRPEMLYLGATIETAGSDYYVPMLDGRSSTGRLGCWVTVSAGFGDVGFSGKPETASSWTLELAVKVPLRVYAGVEICQIAFHTPVGERKAYTGKYLKQRDPRASAMWKDFQDGKVRKD